MGPAEPRALGVNLLKVVAARLAGCVRETDTVSRLGGDEFVIALGHLRDAQGAEVVARKVLAALESPCLVGAHTLQAGVSIGVSIYPVGYAVWTSLHGTELKSPIRIWSRPRLRA